MSTPAPMNHVHTSAYEPCPHECSAITTAPRHNSIAHVDTHLCLTGFDVFQRKAKSSFAVAACRPTAGLCRVALHAMLYSYRCGLIRGWNRMGATGTERTRPRPFPSNLAIPRAMWCIKSKAAGSVNEVQSMTVMGADLLSKL